MVVSNRNQVLCQFQGGCDPWILRHAFHVSMLLSWEYEREWGLSNKIRFQRSVPPFMAIISGDNFINPTGIQTNQLSPFLSLLIFRILPSLPQRNIFRTRDLNSTVPLWTPLPTKPVLLNLSPKIRGKIRAAKILKLWQNSIQMNGISGISIYEWWMFYAMLNEYVMDPKNELMKPQSVWKKLPEEKHKCPTILRRHITQSCGNNLGKEYYFYQFRVAWNKMK